MFDYTSFKFLFSFYLITIHFRNFRMFAGFLHKLINHDVTKTRFFLKISSFSRILMEDVKLMADKV